MFSQKSPRFPGNGTFLYFGKSIFRGALSIFRTMTSLESWHIQNLGIFLTQGIIRTPLNIYDGTFYKNSFLVHIRKFFYFHMLQKTETPKKLLIFSQKKAFLIIQEAETSKKFVIFQEMVLCYISGKVYSEL